MTNAEAVQNMSYVPVQNNPGAQLPHPLHSFSKQSAEALIKTEQKEDIAVRPGKGLRCHTKADLPQLEAPVMRRFLVFCCLFPF